MADRQSGGILAQLVEELNSKRIHLVDLTTTLSPSTPVIDLPPIFSPSPGLTLTEISRYDSRGPAWYWNVLTLGEHTGTHFDAPIHWIHWQRSSRECDRYDRAAQIHRPRLRHRRDGGCAGQS